MPFQRPSLNELISRNQADVEARLPGTNPHLRHSLLGILTRMESGAVHELYGALSWVAANSLPDTTDPDMLSRWAAIYGVGRLQPTAATGNVSFTGAGNVPAGTLLSSLGGIQYATDADIAVPGGGTVTAVLAGAAGNVSAGASLSLVSPVAGIDSTALVGADGLSGGADIESVDAWSVRLMQRIQKPPQGGSVDDYVAWAKASHPAITNVWVRRATPTPGSVTVYLMSYGASDSTNGIPSTATLAAAEDDITAKAPVAARLFVFAPQPHTIDATVKLSPLTAATQASALAALQELFEREAVPGGAIPLSHLDQAISNAAGEFDHSIIGITQADLTTVAGDILILGDVTFEAFQ